jgi:hypothetical protein
LAQKTPKLERGEHNPSFLRRWEKESDAGGVVEEVASLVKRSVVSARRMTAFLV